MPKVSLKKKFQNGCNIVSVFIGYKAFMDLYFV